MPSKNALQNSRKNKTQTKHSIAIDHRPLLYNIIALLIHQQLLKIDRRKKKTREKITSKKKVTRISLTTTRKKHISHCAKSPATVAYYKQNY